MASQTIDRAVDYKYWAFISYSHADNFWGRWLHRAIESYRVPRALVGKPSRDGTVPRRLYPVFRDREELPISADLGANIKNALEASRYMIVICSPQAARSRCNRWMDERRQNGWTFATSRDNSRKHHPLLVPWTQLSEPEKEKDRDTVRNLAPLIEKGGFRLRKIV